MVRNFRFSKAFILFVTIFIDFVKSYFMCLKIS